MNKLRCSLATIALAVTLLSGLSFQGMGAMANAASNHHVSSAGYALVVGQSMKSTSVRNDWPCDTSNDC